ncbi:MAG: hypothetical protein KDC54_06505 [Lewinella sp.]|nr:hypothetical protein [Lewinella sp.]
MKGAIFFSGKYGSTEQYSRWITEAAQDERYGFDYVDQSSIEPIVQQIRQLQHHEVAG